MIKITKQNATKLDAKGILEIIEGTINFSYMEKGATEATVDTLTLDEISEIFDGKEVKFNITATTKED